MRSSGAHQQADDCLEETIGASVLHLRVDFAGVLKAVSHIEILKLYMFLLQKYKALDAATLHAIAAYLGRLCNELRLEPMMYQVRYYQLRTCFSQTCSCCLNQLDAILRERRSICITQFRMIAYPDLSSYADILPQAVSYHPL